MEHAPKKVIDRKKIDLSVESARKRINNDVTHSKSLSSANDFPKIPEKHQSKSSLVTKTLPILLLHKNILCSMASRTFPPLFLFFSLRIIMSALKKIEKEISETDLDHIKSGPNELVIGNFWIFKGKITIQKQQNCSDNRRRRNWKLM